MMKGDHHLTIISFTGFVIILLFYISYFYKMLLQRLQGITTDQLGRGNKGKRTYIIEVILKLSTFSMAGVQMISIVMNDKWFLLIHNSALRITGIAIAAGGLAIFITAMATMRTSWRAGIDSTQKTELVRNGIYKWSRNPAFLGFDLFYAGIALAFCNPLQLVFLLLCITVLHLQILEEERYLLSAFGASYAAYKKSTGRYFMFF
jgi:protein-S-isoprenylcysteine O-methyltransferase Ste14